MTKLISTYYVIQHKETKQIMPLARRNRGYSHWNPGSPTPPPNIFLDMPRLLNSEKQAKRCISQWFNCPNAVVKVDDGYIVSDIDIKDDGRKKEDLEVVKAFLEIDTP